VTDIQVETQKIVNDILVERFEMSREKLVAAANLRQDLKLDSLDFVDMIVILESKVQGKMPEFDFLAINTLGDIYNLVEKILSTAKI
jgi:acyl carrier protein